MEGTARELSEIKRVLGLGHQLECVAFLTEKTAPVSPDWSRLLIPNRPMAVPNPLKLVNARIDVVRAIPRSLDPTALRARLAPLRGLSYRHHPAVLDLTEIGGDALAAAIDSAPWTALRDCFEEIGLKVVAVSLPEGFDQAEVLTLLLGLAQVDSASMGLRLAADPAPTADEAPSQLVAAPPESAGGRRAAPSAATDEPPATHEAMPEALPPEPDWLPPLVIERHVRSGQQIYGRRRDLLILASVSPGAEVIADGNITCLGELQGRAIAGASGKVDARILCLHFRPELVAVAGVYKTFESGPPEFAPGRTVQVRQARDGDGLSITVL